MPEQVDELPAHFPDSLRTVGIARLVVWLRDPSEAPPEVRHLLFDDDVRAAIFEAARLRSPTFRRRGGIIEF